MVNKRLRFQLYEVLLAFLMFSGIACLESSRSFDEVARVPNPTSKFDAVIAEMNGGATTSFWHEVFVVERGKKIEEGKGLAHFYGAVRSEQAYGVNLEWEGTNSLVIEYLKAEDANLRLKSIAINNEVISIQLQSGISDSNAPTGGMLYNLQKTKLN